MFEDALTEIKFVGGHLDGEPGKIRTGDAFTVPDTIPWSLGDGGEEIYFKWVNPNNDGPTWLYVHLPEGRELDEYRTTLEWLQGGTHADFGFNN